MNRKIVNKIRFVFEELLPPIIRDSIIFKYIVKYFYRSDKEHETLKENILNFTDEQYTKYYKAMPEIQGETDNSEDCINFINEKIIPNDVFDVGCGRGLLLERIRKKNKNLNLYGAEIFKSEKLKIREEKFNLKIYEIKIENLNSIDKKFDTVICTHVLEHVLNIRMAYKNLKKICKDTLIIVVPKERPYKYTFNGHLHFFPYEWSLVNILRPEPNSFSIKNINRDFVYIEKIKK